jgi:hypothetical protein
MRFNDEEQIEAARGEATVVFERNGDAWQSRGPHARDVAAAIGIVVVQDNGEDAVFFWDYHKDRYADALREAGFEPIFADRK